MRKCKIEELGLNKHDEKMAKSYAWTVKEPNAVHTAETQKEAAEVFTAINSVAAAAQAQQLMTHDKVTNYENLLNDERAETKATVKVIAKELQEMDKREGNTTTEAHKAQLDKALSFVTDTLGDVLPEMSVKINRKAERNGGAIMLEPDGKGDTIYLNARPEGSPLVNGEKSMYELYTHEMSHAALKYGLNAMGKGSGPVIRRLTQLRDAAMKKLTVDDFMPGVSINKAIDRANAQRLYDYVYTNLDEFWAYALTDEKVFNKIKDLEINKLPNEKTEGFVDTVMALIHKLVHAATMKFRGESASMKGDELLYKLSAQIMQANNKAKAKLQDGFLGRIDAGLDHVDTWWANNVDKVKDKMAGSPELLVYPQGASRLKKIQWVVKHIGKMIRYDHNTPILKSWLADAFYLKEDGFAQRLFQTTAAADAMGNTMQSLTLRSKEIDRGRERAFLQITNMIRAAFKKPPKIAQRKVMYSTLLRNDGNYLVEKYGENELISFYKDDKALQKEINKVQRKLDKTLNTPQKNFVNYQIDGLVKFMETGVGSIAQLKNAESIARFFGTADPVVRTEKNSAEIDARRDAIDRLASLKAIAALDPEVKAQMVELLTEDYAGVQALAESHRGLWNTLIETKSSDELINLPKNYVRETYEDHISSEVAPVSKRRKMKDEGYTLVEILPKSGLNTAEVQMGLYVSNQEIQQKMNRTAARYMGNDQQGRTLFVNALQSGSKIAVTEAKRDLATGKRDAYRAIGSVITKGEAKDVNTVLMPEFNAQGEIIDFRFTTPLETKITHLGLVQDAVKGVGRSHARALDEVASRELNEVLWSEMLKDMAQNYRPGMKAGADGSRYVVLDIHSTDKKLADLARLVPKEMKDKLRKLKDLPRDEEGRPDQKAVESIVGKEIFEGLNGIKKDRMLRAMGKGKLAIRRDMLIDAIGFRDIDLANLPGINRLPAAAKKLIRFVEAFWKELVALFKVTVVIKIWAVIHQNIISGIIQIMQMGNSNPMEVVNTKIEGFKALGRYLKDEAELTREKGQYAADKNPNRARRIKQLEDNLKRNPVHYLIESGLYQHILEDVSQDDFKSSSRITNWVGARSEKVPEWIRMGSRQLFITEKSAMFQAVQKLTTSSDFVARYAMIELGLKKADKAYRRENNGKTMPVARKEALRKELTIKARDQFINYSRPDDPILQKVNDLGFAAFTKWAIRIHRIMADGIAKHPTRFLLALMGQEMIEDVTGWNPPDIYDANIVNRGPVFFYIPGLTGIAETLLTPALVLNWQNEQGIGR